MTLLLLCFWNVVLFSGCYFVLGLRIYHGVSSWPIGFFSETCYQSNGDTLIYDSTFFPSEFRFFLCPMFWQFDYTVLRWIWSCLFWFLNASCSCMSTCFSRLQKILATILLNRLSIPLTLISSSFYWLSSPHLWLFQKCGYSFL